MRHTKRSSPEAHSRPLFPGAASSGDEANLATQRTRVPHSRMLRFTSTAAAFLLAATVLAACASANSGAAPATPAFTAAKTSHVLNAALTANTQPPDPDVFYAGQGLAITTSVYQGLVQYAPNTTQHRIVPDLATSWAISPNGLTYTFQLRTGVFFHDGTPFTSTAVAASFDRRLAVNQAPAYMLADLASVGTSNPHVAIVRLKKPNSAFLDYLASAYGPKMESPTALAAHAGATHDQTWMKTHDAGTGPYYIASVVPGQKYVLKAFPKYWGPKPYYTTVNISIIPDMSTQQLELQRGQLSIIMNDYLPGPAIQAFRANPAFTVTEVPTLEMPMIWVNERHGLFASQTMRTDLAKAIDRRSLTQSVFPGRANVSSQIYPKGILPAGTATFKPTYNPHALTKAVAKLSNKSLQLAYQADDPTSKLMANLLQAELATTGLQVTVVAVPQATIYNWPGNPGPSLPDLLIETNWPDAYNPDTWARIVMTPGGGLNYLNCNVPSGTALLNAGRAASAPTQVARDYEKAGNAFAASGCWIPLANKEGTVVAPSWMSGISYQKAVPHTVIIADLHPK
ncbi:MAG: ABC transporter substrate-binding protein [Actinomycetota bacterium]|nr:ABC transporter substrate-binding protein [Actinomycetota bacterium]